MELYAEGNSLRHLQNRLPVALESHIQAMLEDDDPMPDTVENLVSGGVLRVNVGEPVA